MAQVTLYLDEQTQARLRDAAARQQVSQSQFVVDLIRRATADTWPDEVLALAGSVPEFPGSDELRRGLVADAERAPW